VKLLALAQLEPATTLRRGEERLALAGDQRIDDEPDFIHKPCVVPRANHWLRSSLSVRWAQTRSIGPGSKRWIVKVVGSVSTP
jgi:hypothetical protein